MRSGCKGRWAGRAARRACSGDVRRSDKSLQLCTRRGRLSPPLLLPRAQTRAQVLASEGLGRCRRNSCSKMKNRPMWAALSEQRGANDSGCAPSMFSRRGKVQTDTEPDRQHSTTDL